MINQELNKLFTSVPETITDISQIINESLENPKNIYFVRSKKSIIVNGITYSGLDSLSYDSSAILNSSNLLTSGTIYNELQKQTLIVNATITTQEDNYMQATLDKSYNEIYDAVKSGSKVYIYNSMYGGTYMIPTSFTGSSEHTFVTTMNGDIWLGFIYEDDSGTVFALQKFVVNNTIEEIQQYSESVDVSVGDTFEEAISKLIHIIEEDEYVTSSALNDINTRLIDTSNYVDSLLPFTQAEKDKLATIADNAEVNVQSDWNETDDTLDSYIKNKPSIPTKFSELTNDTSVDIIKSISDYTVSIDISVGDTHDEAFSKIRKVIKNNEKVVAAALNDLNDRLLDVTDEVSTITIPTKVSELINDSNYISSNDSSIVTAADIANWNSKTSNVGTITGINMNGVSKGDSGVVNLGTLVNNISYDSTNRKINLNYDSSVVSSIDANAFIKDGMVSNVTIADSSLIITFNTDADKEDIELSLTDIFDPDNYYNKTDVSSFTKVREITEYEDTTDVSVGDTHDVAISKLRQIIIDNEYVTAAALNDLETRKVDSSMLPTKLSQLTNDANYVQDENYVHTDNNYTTAEKTKLENLEIYNFDNEPTSDSSNLLTSGTIYNTAESKWNIISILYDSNTDSYSADKDIQSPLYHNILVENDLNNHNNIYNQFTLTSYYNNTSQKKNTYTFENEELNYYYICTVNMSQMPSQITWQKEYKNTHIESIIELNWVDLQAIKTNNKLIPGQQYRIIDYNTILPEETIENLDCSVGNHQFDIIVTALDSSTLDEKASAIQHDGDTYFANSNLNVWELKYCIDNNSVRFETLANEDNGTGVIYYMKDEYNNECYYDFKNILFKKKINVSGALDESDGTDTYVYTFNKTTNGIQEDDTLTGSSSNNIINNGCEIIVFLGNAKYNIIGSLSYNITFGNNCEYNILGEDCMDIIFGNNYRYNICGKGVYGLTIDTDYVEYCNIESNVNNIILTSTATMENNILQNITILSGSYTINDMPTTITHNNINSNYKFIYAINSNGQIVGWNPADHLLPINV